MNKDLTLVFSSYQSQHLLTNLLRKFDKKYRIIVIENSLDLSVKQLLEKKFKNVNVIIPKKNLGLAKSYNLGIKKAKTKFVFLNNPDMIIDEKSIKGLILCAKKIKRFGAISPAFKNENIYKNYKIFNKRKNQKSKFFKKYNIIEVDLLDNNFLIDKKQIKNYFFDENYFLYFETFDFTLNLKKKGKKLYVIKSLKFHHLGSSLKKNYRNLVLKTRSFHYNWSKFYYFKKNYSYFLAFKKSVPNIIRAIKKIIIGIFKFDFNLIRFSFIELIGIFSGLFFLKSYYRPNNS